MVGWEKKATGEKENSNFMKTSFFFFISSLLIRNDERKRKTRKVKEHMEDAADMNVHKLHTKKAEIQVIWNPIRRSWWRKKARKTSSRGCLHLNRAVSGGIALFEPLMNYESTCCAQASSQLPGIATCIHYRFKGFMYGTNIHDTPAKITVISTSKLKLFYRTRNRLRLRHTGQYCKQLIASN